MLAPLPKWIVEHCWGEEFRGSALDTAEAVQAARSLLDKAEPPADFIHYEEADEFWEGHKTPRPTKREVTEAEKILDRHARESEREEARQVIENAEKERDTRQLFVMCKQVFALGISEARARVLIDLFWNTRGNQAYAPEQLDKEITRVWRPDLTQSDTMLDRMPRRLRWRYRETDWLMAEGESEDLLLGEFLTATSRLMMYAPTGCGKTSFALAIAFHVSAGADFLHWKGSGKPRSVLYIDGEMSKASLRGRFQDAARRLGKRPSGLVVLSSDQTPELPPLDTPEGQRWLDRYIEDHGPFHLIIFDNIASLLAGSMIGPESWRATLAWIKNLTARGIAQIWLHHTGLDKSHAYGDSTRE